MSLRSNAPRVAYPHITPTHAHAAGITPARGMPASIRGSPRNPHILFIGFCQVSTRSDRLVPSASDTAGVCVCVVVCLGRRVSLLRPASPLWPHLWLEANARGLVIAVAVVTLGQELATRPRSRSLSPSALTWPDAVPLGRAIPRILRTRRNLPLAWHFTRGTENGRVAPSGSLSLNKIISPTLCFLLPNFSLFPSLLNPTQRSSSDRELWLKFAVYKSKEREQCLTARTRHAHRGLFSPSSWWSLHVNRPSHLARSLG